MLFQVQELVLMGFLKQLQKLISKGMSVDKAKEELLNQVRENFVLDAFKEKS